MYLGGISIFKQRYSTETIAAMPWCGYYVYVPGTMRLSTSSWWQHYCGTCLMLINFSNHIYTWSTLTFQPLSMLMMPAPHIYNSVGVSRHLHSLCLSWLLIFILKGEWGFMNALGQWLISTLTAGLLGHGISTLKSLCHRFQNRSGHPILMAGHPILIAVFLKRPRSASSRWLTLTLFLSA